MAVFTQNFTVGQTAWVNLGNGPLLVKQLSATRGVVQIIVSDTAPNLSDTGYPLFSDETNSEKSINQNCSVWAKLNALPDSSISVSVSVLYQGRAYVETLGVPTIARQQAVTVTSSNVVLSAATSRISMLCRNAPVRFSVGSTAQTANATTSHYIGSGERQDFDVPMTTPNIAFIRSSDAITDAIIEITEMT